MQRLGVDPDKEWERIGRTEPYYGVQEYDELLSKNIDDSSLDRFFSTGEADTKRLFDTIDRKIRQGFEPTVGLDYGCGVGRMLIPFSKRCQKVIGLDISESMMAEAAKNCHRFNVINVEFHKADDDLSAVTGKVDLVHTHEVLQHIPVKRGMVIIENLVDRLNEGGVGYIQFPYKVVAGGMKERVRPVLYRSKTLYGMANVMMGGSFSDRRSEMNRYDLDEVLRTLQGRGVTDVLVVSESMGDFLTAELFFQK